MENDVAIGALRELSAARGLLDHWELAQRATAILDRSELRPLSIVDYLQQKGVDGPALARMVGKFAPRVKSAYVAKYGVEPLHRLELIPALGERRPVHAYLETDRPLFDGIWAALSAEHDVVMRRVDEVERSGVVVTADLVGA